MSKKTLIITDRTDAHMPYVLNHFHGEVEPVLLDARDILAGVELTYELTDGPLGVRWGDYDLADVVSVWYRKPVKLDTIALHVKPEYVGYAGSALAEHSGSLDHLFHGATWINRPSAIRACVKPRQLALARRLGLRVPETVITSDPGRARGFIRDIGPCVFKPLANVFPESADGKVRSLFTRRIDLDANFERLSLAPSIFQRAIDTKYSLRAAVVGDRAFVSRIDTEPREHDWPVLDWRHEELEGRVRHRPCFDVDDRLVRALVELVRELGLLFGAIDLIVDHEDEIWFLEVNANGQWAFVDDETTFLIGRALAQLLETGGTSAATRLD